MALLLKQLRSVAALAILAAGAGAEEPPAPRPVVPLFGEADEGAAAIAWGLGPIDAGDPYPLALAHFMIPIDTPETAPAGHVRIRGPHFTWANTQVLRVEETFDVEVLLSSVRVDLGLTDRWEISAQLPFHRIGSGVLDGMIDGFHEAIDAISADRDEGGRYKYELRAGDTTIRRGFRLGDASIGTKLRFIDHGRFLPALSAAAWLKIPTASSPSLGRQGWDAAVSLQASKRFGPLVFYGGVSTSLTSDTEMGDIGYRRSAWTIWGGGELGIAPGLAFVAHAWGRGALLRGSTDIAHRQCYVVAGVRYRFRLPAELGGLDVELSAGAIENYRHLESSSDFGWVFGVDLKF